MDFRSTGRLEVIRAGLLAALFTLAIFVFLPSLESIRPAREDLLEIRSVETARLAPPPPPPRRPPPPPRAEEAAPERPRPRLERPARRLPLTAMLDFDFGLAAGPGDFALDFALGAGGIGELETGVFELGEIDQIPVSTVKTPPVYPIQAKLRRIEGEVVLQFIVDESGTVREIDVVESAPGDTFVRAALAAVARWRFRPAVKDGRAVAVRVQQKLSFRLD
jgi:periplasmic protein TonB